MAPEPASYRLLCPAGWRRVPPAALADVFGEIAVAKLKEAGRPDLVLQMRGMVSQLRASMRATHVFDAYLPPLIDGNPQPAVLTVAPFARPEGVSWTDAVARAGRNAAVDIPEFTETRMWRWTRDESSERSAEDPAIRTRVRHYVVPASEDEAERRGLHFVHTVLVADDPHPAISEKQATPSRVTEVLLETGDVILGTLRWVTPATTR